MSEMNTPRARAINLSKIEFVCMVAGLMALNAMAIDLMLPALDDIAAHYRFEDTNRQQLVIFAYIFGFGAPQLIWGPLSDSFGRRYVIFVALVGYTVMGIGCMIAGSYWQLLMMRFIQGVFASGSRVIAVSIVRDRFEGRGMASIMSLIMTIFMVVPILAPALGQLVLFIAPWQWTFGVLSIWSGIMMVWSFFRLPETLPVSSRRPFNLRSSLDAYWQVIQHRSTCGYMLASGVIFGSLFAFIGAAEQVFTDVYHKHDTFVLWFAGIAGALSLANFTNSRLVERFGMRKLSQFALCGFVFFALTLLILLIVVGETFWIFFPLFAMMFACFGFIGPNYNALAMEPLGAVAGTGSAAYGFATTTFSSAIGWYVGNQFDGTSIPMITGFVVLGVISFVVVAMTERGRLFQPGRYGAASHAQSDPATGQRS